MILGLTGSIGSGKSFVSECLRELGSTVIDADEIAREVTAPGTPALEEIAREFGRDVLTRDGALDRGTLARRVFSDPAALAKLEAIVHPRVRLREEALLLEYRDRPLVVLEVPLLFETGAEALCDAVLCVTVDEETRRARLVQDRGMTGDQIDQRLSRQMPEAEKARRADHVIDNSGSREATRKLVEKLYDRLANGRRTTHTSGESA